MSTQELIKKLRERGVETRHRYEEPLYKQNILVEKDAYPEGLLINSECYDVDMDYSSLHLPNVEKVVGKVIGLPNHPKLERKELNSIVEVIKSIQ
jgi:dTDP-4-amino-4,6-dideoxygalactose transaminase